MVDGVSHEQVGAFSRRLGDGLRVRSDAFRGLTAMARDHDHEPRPTPPDRADGRLPLVHLVISNFKRFLTGAFHGVSGKRLQERLDEKTQIRRWSARSRACRSAPAMSAPRPTTMSGTARSRCSQR